MITSLLFVKEAIIVLHLETFGNQPRHNPSDWLL